MLRVSCKWPLIFLLMAVEAMIHVDVRPLGAWMLACGIVLEVERGNRVHDDVQDDHDVVGDAML